MSTDQRVCRRESVERSSDGAREKDRERRKSKKKGIDRSEGIIVRFFVTKQKFVAKSI